MAQAKRMRFGVNIIGDIPVIKKLSLRGPYEPYDFFVSIVQDSCAYGNERYDIFLTRSLNSFINIFDFNGWSFQNGTYVANWGESNTFFYIIDCEGKCRKEFLSYRKGTAASIGFKNHIEDMVKSILRISCKYDTIAMYVLNSKRICFQDLKKMDSLSHYSSFISDLSEYLKEADRVIKATEENISTRPKDALCLPVLKSRIKDVIDEFSNYRVVFD